MPLNLLYAYGAGEQINVEDLAYYLAGRERRDAWARWNQLELAYRDLAATVSWLSSKTLMIISLAEHAQPD